jgi:regulator of chromosome condensation
MLPLRFPLLFPPSPFTGADHTAALTSAGALLTWGSGQQGQLGRIGERLSERAKMETLLSPHPVPIKRSRSMRSAHVVDVNCGTYTTFVVVEGGHVLGWGLNNYGQLATPGLAPVYAPVLTKALKGKSIASVRSGQHHTLVITTEGNLLSFGRPTYGRLGQKDAEVGADNPAPEVAAVDGLDGVAVAGASAGLAVSGCFNAEGRGWMWGFGSSNQLCKGDDDEGEYFCVLEFFYKIVLLMPLVSFFIY